MFRVVIFGDSRLDEIRLLARWTNNVIISIISDMKQD